MNSKLCYIKFLICSVLASLLALTSHIYILKFTGPFLELMSKGVNNSPDPAAYSHFIMYSAYLTAFMTTAFLVFLYYHTQHLIPGKSKLTRTLFVILIVFAVKGEPIRQPLMNLILNIQSGMESPVLFVLIQALDKWTALVLLALCLVYLCPAKTIVK